MYQNILSAQDSGGNASSGISLEYLQTTQDALDAKAATNWEYAMNMLGDMGDSSTASVKGYYAQQGYPRLQGTSNIGRDMFSGFVGSIKEPFALIDDGLAAAFGQNRSVISGKFNAESATIQAFQADGVSALWKVPLRGAAAVITSPIRLVDGYVRGDAEQIGNAGATILGTVSAGGLGRMGRTGTAPIKMGPNDGPQLPRWNGPVDYSSVVDPLNVMASSRPTPRQASQMKDLNRQANGGLLRSDIDGSLMVDSLKSTRGVTPPRNEVQVDHIKAIINGGTRESSNLQLITRQQNRIKSDN